tara:strand:- start:12079 stop:12417 length:339 start_codon:yes stop_codon:yes gene_type:complete
MTDPSIIPTLSGLITATGSGVFYKLASVTTATPDWLEHGALALLIFCLIYSVRTLWSANREMRDDMEVMKTQYHNEVKQEMQAQIDAERESREVQAAALKGLTDVLTELKKT